MKRERAPIAGIALSLLLLGAPDTAESPAAEALFEQGRAALARGELDTACARFRESDRIESQPGYVQTRPLRGWSGSLPSRLWAVS